MGFSCIEKYYNKMDNQTRAFLKAGHISGGLLIKSLKFISTS